MTEPYWPETIDSVVKRVRYTDGKSWWDTAAATVAAGLPKDELEYLATMGLTELVSWSHRIDRNAGYACAGQRAAFRRYPDLTELAPEDEPEE